MAPGVDSRSGVKCSLSPSASSDEENGPEAEGTPQPGDRRLRFELISVVPAIRPGARVKSSRFSALCGTWVARGVRQIGPLVV